MPTRLNASIAAALGFIVEIQDASSSAGTEWARAWHRVVSHGGALHRSDIHVRRSAPDDSNVPRRPEFQRLLPAQIASLAILAALVRFNPFCGAKSRVSTR
jgi:hypothetical protein